MLTLCLPLLRLTVRFTELFIAPRFASFSPSVWSRVLTVVDYRPDGWVDWDEFVCYRFVLEYGSREQQLRFVFNLFDLNGSGRVDRDELKRMSVALMPSPSAPQPGAVDVQREFAPLLELLSLLALAAYDRDADRQLSWPEWRLLAEDDERVCRMVDEMNSRRGRRREKQLRQQLSAAAAPRQQQQQPHQLQLKRPQQPQPQQAAREDDGDDGSDGWSDGCDESAAASVTASSSSSLSSSSSSSSSPSLLSSLPLCWSEWGGGLDDDGDLSAWEEYRNRMRTAAGRMTTPTMEASIEGESRPQQQQQQQTAAPAAAAPSASPPPRPPPSLPPGVRLGPGAPSAASPSGGSSAAQPSARSRIFNTVNSLRGKK